MIRTDTFKPNRARYIIGQTPEERAQEEEELLNNMSCDLTKVRMIDFEKFAYGPPGIDIGQFLTKLGRKMTGMAFKEVSRGGIAIRRVYWRPRHPPKSHNILK